MWEASWLFSPNVRKHLTFKTTTVVERDVNPQYIVKSFKLSWNFRKYGSPLWKEGVPFESAATLKVPFREIRVRIRDVLSLIPCVSQSFWPYYSWTQVHSWVFKILYIQIPTTKCKKYEMRTIFWFTLYTTRTVSFALKLCKKLKIKSISFWQRK